MGAYNSTAKTRVEGELHPSRDGRVWSVAQQTYIMPGQAAPPTAKKQTAGVAGAGMGTGGKTYDSGLGAGGVKGMGETPGIMTAAQMDAMQNPGAASPVKPQGAQTAATKIYDQSPPVAAMTPLPSAATNPHRPGSWAATRWDQEHNPQPAATPAPPPPAPTPPADAPLIEGAMTSAQMDAMQAKPAATTPPAPTALPAPPAPLTQQTYTEKLDKLNAAGDTAGITALNDQWAKDAQAALSKPATTPETVQAAAVAAVNPEAALAPLPTVTPATEPTDDWRKYLENSMWDFEKYGNYSGVAYAGGSGPDVIIDMRNGKKMSPGDPGYDEAKRERDAFNASYREKNPRLPIGEYEKTLDRAAPNIPGTRIPFGFNPVISENTYQDWTRNHGTLQRLDNNLPPLPSTVKPQEQLIADQDPNNPISNWQAIGRAVGAEYSPFTYSAADIANEARGFGLDRYLNPEQLAEEQINIQGQQLAEKERMDQENLRNRYGGVGISGNRQRREMEIANQYGLDKALMQNDLRRQARAEGLNANLMVQGNARNVLGDRAAQQEGRFGTMLNSALQQSGQQTGIVQNERGRAWQGNENAAQRQWQTGETQAQRVHDAAVKDAENNQATRGMYTQILAPMLLDMINPKPKSPQDAWYEAQLAKEGVNVGGYDQFSQGGIPGLLNTILGGGGLNQILTAIPALQGLLQGGGY